MNQDEEKEFWKIERNYHNYKRKRALRCMFQGGCIDDELKSLIFYKKWFYWIKTLVCLMFNRTGGSYFDSCYYALAYDFYSGYWDDNWSACWVMRGVFKNWKVCLSSDGG